jgi:hypothetical protein
MHYLGQIRYRNFIKANFHAKIAVHKLPMFKSKPMSQSRDELNYFEQIYQAAKEKNADEIKALLEIVSVDLYDQTADHVPVCKLAYEGDHASVKFLQENFNASEIHVIAGYARAGNLNKITQLLKSPSKKFLKIRLLKEAIFNFALGGKLEEASKLLAQQPNNHKYILAISLAKGLAQTGVEEGEINKILQERNIFHERRFLLRNILYNYALGNHVIIVNKIIASIADSADKSMLLKKVERGYAGKFPTTTLSLRASSAVLLGQLKSAEDYLALAENETQRLLIKRDLIGVYASVGEDKKVFEFLKEDSSNAMFESAMLGYCESGSLFLPIQPYNKDERYRARLYTCFGYACKGYVEDSNVFVTFEADQKRQTAMLEMQVSGLAIYGNENEVFRIAQSQFHESQKINLLKFALVSYVKKQNFFAAAMILDKVPQPHEMLFELSKEFKKLSEKPKKILGKFINYYSQTAKHLKVVVKCFKLNVRQAIEAMGENCPFWQKDVKEILDQAYKNHSHIGEHVRDSEGLTPLMHAVKLTNIYAVNWLCSRDWKLKTPGIYLTDLKNYSALMYAVSFLDVGFNSECLNKKISILYKVLALMKIEIFPSKKCLDIFIRSIACARESGNIKFLEYLYLTDRLDRSIFDEAILYAKAKFFNTEKDIYILLQEYSKLMSDLTAANDAQALLSAAMDFIKALADFHLLGELRDQAAQIILDACYANPELFNKLSGSQFEDVAALKYLAVGRELDVVEENKKAEAEIEIKEEPNDVSSEEESEPEIDEAVVKREMLIAASANMHSFYSQAMQKPKEEVQKVKQVLESEKPKKVERRVLMA